MMNTLDLIPGNMKHIPIDYKELIEIYVKASGRVAILKYIAVILLLRSGTKNAFELAQILQVGSKEILSICFNLVDAGYLKYYRVKADKTYHTWAFIYVDKIKGGDQY